MEGRLFPSPPVEDTVGVSQAPSIDKLIIFTVIWFQVINNNPLKIIFESINYPYYK